MTPEEKAEILKGLAEIKAALVQVKKSMGGEP